MEALIFLGIVCLYSLYKKYDTKDLVLLFLFLFCLYFLNTIIVIYGAGWLQKVTLTFVCQTILLITLLISTNNIKCKILIWLMISFGIACFIGFLYPDFTASTYFIQAYETVVFNELFVLCALLLLSDKTKDTVTEHILYFIWFVINYSDNLYAYI